MATLLLLPISIFPTTDVFVWISANICVVHVIIGILSCVDEHIYPLFCITIHLFPVICNAVSSDVSRGIVLQVLSKCLIINAQTI